LAVRARRAAELLGISKRTAWDWVRTGKLEAVRPSPNITLITMRSIRTLLGV
jgi:predicted site-specific integrase-resolvase